MVLLQEKTILDRCLRKTYSKYLQTYSQNDIPTMVDFHRILEEQLEPEAKI